MATILHVPRRFTPDAWGGTETVILEIARQQLRSGHTPAVVTSLALARSRTDTVGGIPVRRHPYCYPFLGLTAEQRSALDRKGGNLLSPSLLGDLLRTPGVRLFHAHALNRLGGHVRTAARLRRKPYVVSIHGGFFELPPSQAAALAAPVRGRLEWGRPLGALLGSRRVLQDADHVICVGQGEFEMATRSLGHGRLSYLPNGVDVARFAAADGPRFRQEHGIPADAFVILNVARMDPQKNQALLARAFITVRRRIPRAVLVLVGPETEAGYGASVRAILEGEGMMDSVRMLPGIRHEDQALVQAYHACDAFALPSIHEPFGIVVLEAWSAARPVVASRVGGLRGLIRHDETGWFIDPESADAAARLADALTRFVDEPAAARRLGMAGHEEVRRLYDWTRIARRLEDIYAGAVDHAGRRYHRAPGPAS